MKHAIKKIISFALAAMLCFSTVGVAMRPGYAVGWSRERLEDEAIPTGDGLRATAAHTGNYDDSLRNYYSSVFVTGLDGRTKDMTVTVMARRGAFPEDAILSVTPVPAYESGEIDAAVEESRARGALVAASYTFDIKMVGENGVEYQPTDGRDVYISFSMDQIANENLDTQVYHIAESGDTLAAESLYTQTQNDTATVATGGFSYYTVEFTYGELCYVLQGGEAVPLSEILSYVGIYGEIEAAYGSNDALFSISNEGGIWTVTSHEAFDTTEWLRVTVGGVEYEITVTDDNTSHNVPVLDPNDPTQQFYSGTVSTRLDNSVAVKKDKYYYGDPDADPPVLPTAGKPTIVKQSQSTDKIYDFAAGLPLSTIFIDETKLGSDKGTFEVADNNETYTVTELSSMIIRDPGTNLVSYNPSASAAGHLLNGTVNKLDGPLFSFTFEDAAILKDGTKANVKITYSNARIFTDERLAVMEQVALDHLAEATQQGDATEIAAAQAELAASYLQGTVALAQGSTIENGITDTRKLTTAGTKTGFSQKQVEEATKANKETIDKYRLQPGLENITEGVYNTQALGKSIDITYHIVDDAGKPINGNFIFAFVGINLDRDPYQISQSAGKGLWWVHDTYPDMHFLSEQIAVTNSSIASDYIYVRANNAMVEELNDATPADESCRTGFYPEVVEATEDGVKKTKFISNIGNPGNIKGNDGYYSSGFVTLATSGFTITGYGHCFGGGNMNTQAYGARRIWYSYTSQTGPNGNIQTTTEGNYGGTLNDTSDKGTKSDILDPNTYVVPEGKTVTYTLTPDSKYQIAKLQVKNASGGIQEIKFNGEPLSTMQPGQYYQFRDAARQLCTLTALADGKFTLEMPYAQHDEEVRVQWERTDAEVTVKKETVNNKTGSFPFKIRAWKNEYVTTYNTGTAWEDAKGSVWKTADPNDPTGTTMIPKAKIGATDLSDADAADLALVVSGIILKEKIDVSGQGGKYLWKTDKKLSDVGLATAGSADDDDLFVNWETAGSAVDGDTLASVLDAGARIFFYDPNTGGRNETTHWNFGAGEGQSSDPGSYSFNLTVDNDDTNDNHIKVFKIPQKYQYEVYEVTPTDWELVSVRTQRTAHPGGNTVTYDDTAAGANKSGGLLTEENGTTPVHTYTNRELPDLTVKKQTYNNVSGSFDFTVNFTEPPVDAQIYGITVTADVAFDSEGNKTISYEITNSGAEFAVDGIAIPKGSSNYGVSNGLDVVFNKLLAMTDGQSQSIKLGTENGEVRMSTTAAQSLGAWAAAQSAAGTQTATFTFTSPAKAALPYSLPTPLPQGVQDGSDDGEYTISSLNAGGSVTFRNLPYGVTYNVLETPPGGKWLLWTPDTTNTFGTVPDADGNDVTATFTNRQKPSLTIKKTVTGVGDKDKYFCFLLELLDEDGNGIENIPAPYLLDSSGSPTGSMVHDWDEYGGGTYEFYLKHGEWFTIEGLPVGAIYSLTEMLDDTSYDVAVNISGDTPLGGSETHQIIDFTEEEELLNQLQFIDNYLGGDATVEYVNNRDPDKLTISKTVTGYGNQNKDWAFTLTLMDLDNTTGNTVPNTNFQEPTGAQNWHNNGDGTYSFTLKHGESLTITMPTAFSATHAYVFTVVEDEANQGGYTTTFDYSSPLIGAADTDVPADYSSQLIMPVAGDTVVAFKNDKQTLDLEIEKLVAGNMGSKAREFEFMITLQKPSDDPTDPPGTMVPINGLPAPSGATDWEELGYGAYSFKLKHGDSVKILGLPYGTKYEVLEAQPLDGYYTTSIVVDHMTTAYSSTIYEYRPTRSAVSPGEPAYRAYVTDVMNEDVKITYTNTKTSTPPTGLHDSLGPALAGFVTATMLFAVSRLGRRRRRNA